MKYLMIAVLPFLVLASCTQNPGYNEAVGAGTGTLTGAAIGCGIGVAATAPVAIPLGSNRKFSCNNLSRGLKRRLLYAFESAAHCFFNNLDDREHR